MSDTGLRAALEAEIKAAEDAAHQGLSLALNVPGVSTKTLRDFLAAHPPEPEGGDLGEREDEPNLHPKWVEIQRDIALKDLEQERSAHAALREALADLLDPEGGGDA